VQVSSVEVSQYKQKLYNSDPGPDLLLLTFLLLLPLLLLLLLLLLPLLLFLIPLQHFFALLASTTSTCSNPGCFSRISSALSLRSCSSCPFASLSPYLPICHHLSLKRLSMPSRDRPDVSGMKNQAHNPPTMVIAVKNQKVPLGERPPCDVSRSMLGTARELPYLFTKWKHITSDELIARMRRGRSRR
jgi:hypothetical protein